MVPSNKLLRIFALDKEVLHQQYMTILLDACI